jgi:hypothetical protein
LEALNLPFRVLHSYNYNLYLAARSASFGFMIFNLYSEHSADLFFVNLIKPTFFICPPAFRTVQFYYYNNDDSSSNNYGKPYVRIQNNFNEPVILYHGEGIVELNYFGNYFDVYFEDGVSEQVILGFSNDSLKKYFYDAQTIDI